MDMNTLIGFILITHTKPQQIIRLMTKLNKMFDNPLIVCHHDFSKCNLAVDAIPKNVSFVYPHLHTGWGEFSTVEATVRAIQRMYEAPTNPDWFVLLSGADYPIKSSGQIVHDLTSSPHDAHIHFEQIKYKAYEVGWHRSYYERYCSVRLLSFPFLTRRLNLVRRELRLTHPVLTTPFLPFSEKFHCFGGSSWFCANRRAAEYIIEFHKTRPDVTLHYQGVKNADESYFQTILANAPHLKLHTNNWRYTDWSLGDDHPKTLGMEDLPQLLASSAHFARKFDIDVDQTILDELDIITIP